MNIQQAKVQITNAITAYRTRDLHNRPTIPQHRQRPIFLMGAPGLGKTAIMEQIAQEMGLPLVSYSMTHHTRQSALGLPFIAEKEYDGQKYRVSEYTMSEIIAALYEKMEQTGSREGILFLDEINCVSETLAPAMLQFLQYKVFGQHKVPEGWIVVTAGNPPEYNQSVREFDMVTWDRLKRIDVEPDFAVWHAWAVDQGVHAAVLSFLDIRKGDLYQVESTVDGKRFVTPRGWVDLSDMLKLYELHNLPVDDQLISQYIQNAAISKAFANYYQLWQKYKGDYQVEAILNGKASDNTKRRAQAAKFDERISLISLIMDAMLNEIRPVMRERELMELALKALQGVRKGSVTRRAPIRQLLMDAAAEQQLMLERGRSGAMLTRTAEYNLYNLIAFLEDAAAEIPEDMDDTAAFAMAKAAFDTRVKALKKLAAATGKKLENVFNFAELVFGEGQEMLIIVTELTAASDAARFIAQYGCKPYFRHNKELLFYERHVQVINQIDQLEAALNSPTLQPAAESGNGKRLN